MKRCGVHFVISMQMGANFENGREERKRKIGPDPSHPTQFR